MKKAPVLQQKINELNEVESAVGSANVFPFYLAKVGKTNPSTCLSISDPTFIHSTLGILPINYAIYHHSPKIDTSPLIYKHIRVSAT